MKLLKNLFIAFGLFTLCCCSQQNSTVDYSNCPYIGSGSHYMVTAGSGESYKTMHFFFDPDGIGAWVSTKIVSGKEVRDVNEFTYTLTGEVNILWVEKKSEEKGKGYFTTYSTGQVFVCEGIYFYRYS